MNIFNQHRIKAIYRVTGTPENFLTALRFGVWGFNIQNKDKWEKLNSGDIIFFHSKGADSKFLNNPTPSVIGFGVVGNNFYIDKNPLWIDEYLDGRNYPFKFAFSELYFFTNIWIDETWDSTSLSKKETTTEIIKKVLQEAIPLSELEGFPHMGSYSAIQSESVRKYLLGSTTRLSLYKGVSDTEATSKSTDFKESTSAEETLRYGTSLTIFDDIKKRIISKGKKEYSVNLESLATAEKSHYDIIAHLRNLFSEKKYLLYYNNHVDLFAFKKNKSILVEAKSIENLNFRSQSRKGIVQLYEYNYFEVAKFKKDRDLKFEEENKLLATSDIPKDKEYIKFINSLDIKTIAVKNKTVTIYGNSIDFAEF